MKTRTILLSFIIMLLLSSCSHNMMVEMARDQALHDYATGHHDRQQYQDDLDEIEAFSNEWKTEQSKEKTKELP